MTDRRGREAGFAVIEVVIGAAIIAMMMALTFRSIAANAQASRIVAERRQAAMLAQSVLAQASASPDAAAQVAQGRDGALTWRVGRTAYPSEGAPLERVAVEVRDATGPVLTLQTLRVAR